MPFKGTVTKEIIERFKGVITNEKQNKKSQKKCLGELLIARDVNISIFISFPSLSIAQNIPIPFITSRGCQENGASIKCLQNSNFEILDPKEKGMRNISKTRVNIKIHAVYVEAQKFFFWDQFLFSFPYGGANIQRESLW